MQEKRIKASEEDLSLLELAVGQILKAKKGSFCPEEYEQVAQTLRKIKDFLKDNEVIEQDYTAFFDAKRPFYVTSNTKEEFYVTRRKTLFTRRSYKAYRSFEEPKELVFANLT